MYAGIRERRLAAIEAASPRSEMPAIPVHLIPFGPIVARLRAITSRPAFKVGGSLLFAQGLTAIVGLIGARALGPAGKGQVTAVLTWAQLLVFVFLLGLSVSLSVRTAESRGDDLGVILGNAVAFSVLVSIIVGVTASLVLSHALRGLGADTPRLIRWAMFGGALTMGGDLFASIHVALGRNQKYSQFRLALPVVGVVLMVPLWLAGRLTAGWVVAGFVLGAAAALAVVSVGLPWRSIHFDPGCLLQDVRYGLKSHVASVVGAVNIRLDLLVMSVFLSATTVGIYGLANSVMIVLTAIPAAGGILMLRSVAWAGGGNPEAEASQLRSIRQGARKYLLLTALLGMILFVAAPVLIHVLLGPRYTPSVQLIQILTPGYVARAYLAVMTVGAVGARRPWVGNIAEGVALMVTAVLLTLLLPRYGATGAAITSTCAYVVAAIVGWQALLRAERNASKRPSGIPDRDNLDDAASGAARLA